MRGTELCGSAHFELYFRRNPRGGGFTVFAGTAAVLEILRRSAFEGTVRAVPEGAPVFPGEPVLSVQSEPASFLKIAPELLRAVCDESAAATVSARLSLAAEGAEVQYAEQSRHRLANNAFVYCFADERGAFEYLCREYADDCVLPVDTFSTLKSGIPYAIAVLQAMRSGHRAVKISSGDIAYQAIHARRLLDEAGLPDCRIHAGGALDEFLIRDLKRQGAPIDVFCVDKPAMCNEFTARFAVSDADGLPRMTRSQNIDKITPPAPKQLWRILDNNGKALADVVSLYDEKIRTDAPYTLFDPHHPWKRREVSDFTAVPLLHCIWADADMLEHGRNKPQTATIAQLWDEVLRFENPHKYYVDYSQPLWDLFQRCMAGD
ncbi:MAG: hypothetical protein LBT21_04750 [Oscillospiraceae bacterium]|nr:hypothetical protein [Oscillospiraceae bacterium]